MPGGKKSGKSGLNSRLDSATESGSDETSKNEDPDVVRTLRRQQTKVTDP